jgi:hypothetical protein
MPLSFEITFAGESDEVGNGSTGLVPVADGGASMSTGVTPESTLNDCVGAFVTTAGAVTTFVFLTGGRVEAGVIDVRYVQLLAETVLICRSPHLLFRALAVRTVLDPA